VCFVSKDNTFQVPSATVVPKNATFSEQTPRFEAFVPVFGLFSEQNTAQNEISRPKRRP
jgi:hypothetical protein